MGQRSNSWLHAANKARADEFYTLPETVEQCLPDYRESFRGKRVACVSNDDPNSVFMRFLADHFTEYGLRSLTGVSFNESDLFHQDNHGVRYDYDPTNRRFIARDLHGSGSFNSEEVLCLLDCTDLVVGNPPFSLARRYVQTVLDADCDLLCLGHQNMLAYSTIFPLVMAGRLRVGTRIHSGGTWFRIPCEYDATRAFEKRLVHGETQIRVSGIRWLTTLRPDQPERLPFPEGVPYDPQVHERYDSYPAVNASSIRLIPCDYPGLIGVPVTILDYDLDASSYRMIGILHSNVGGYDFGKPVIHGKTCFNRILLQHK